MSKQLKDTSRIDDIYARLASYEDRGLLMCLSSSFQTQSLPLLHILSRYNASIPVVFVNTGYLFPESLVFRDRIVQMLGIRLIECRPSVAKSEQRDENGNLLFVSDPGRCCQLNKIDPMESILSDFDVWISGVRAEQTEARRRLQVEQPGPDGVLRYHPMLEWTAKEIYDYRKQFQLPEHPLEERGFVSVGCMPCTMTTERMGQDQRRGRWYGCQKTECGLHTELAAAQEPRS